MSRGGRGRGRFGRGNSVTHDLLRDNLEDLGVDSLNPDDRAPPALFPPTEQAPPSAPSPAQLSLLTRLAGQHAQSACLLSRSSSGVAGAGGRLEDFARALFPLGDHLQHVPLELYSLPPSSSSTHSHSNAPASSGRGSAALAPPAARGRVEGRGARRGEGFLHSLEKAEGEAGKGEEGEEGKSEAEDGDAEAEEGEGEAEDDYLVDHYASDDNSAGADEGGDYEATF